MNQKPTSNAKLVEMLGGPAPEQPDAIILNTQGNDTPKMLEEKAKALLIAFFQEKKQQAKQPWGLSDGKTSSTALTNEPPTTPKAIEPDDSPHRPSING